MSVEAASQAAGRLMSEVQAVLNRSLMWGRLEDAWLNAIAALLPSIPGDMHGVVSQVLLGLAAESHSPLVLQSMGAALASLRWDRIPRQDQNAWLEFARGHLNEVSDRQFVATAAVTGLSAARPSEVERLLVAAYEKSASLLHGALLLDIHRHPSRRILKSIAEQVLRSVATTKAQAHAGTYSLGTIRTGFMLARLASRLRTRELWDAVVALVTDSRAPSEMRADALTVLAQGGRPVPKAVVNKLREIKLTDVAPIPLESSERLIGTWLRFRAAYRIEGESQLLSDFLDLATAPEPRARMEAAASVAALRSIVGNEALATTTAILSRDPNPHVRAAAARSLPLLTGDASAVGQRIRQRLQEVLADPGDAAPLAALHGLEEARRVMDEPVLRSQVAMLAARHPSRMIREAAAGLLA
jgi:hypothetical protein